MKTFMKTFAQFISEHLHVKQQLAADFKVAESIIDRWAAGVSNPLPMIKSAVEDVLRKYDPQGLIKMGAPDDEYSSEAKDATHHLFLSRTIEEFQKALWAIFICSFSVHSAGELKDYEAMAKEIWSIKG